MSTQIKYESEIPIIWAQHQRPKMPKFLFFKVRVYIRVYMKTIINKI